MSKQEAIEQIRRIKNRYPLVDTIERMARIEVDLRGNGERKIICPMPHHIHTHNTASFSIRTGNGTGFFECFGACGAKGDVIDFVGFYMFGDAYIPSSAAWVKKAVDNLGCITTAQMPPERHMEPRKRIPMELVLSMWAALRESSEAKRYLEYRGLLGLEDEYKLGYKLNEYGTKYLSIPCIYNDQVEGIKYRLMDTSYPDPKLRSTKLRFYGETGSRLSTFNLDKAIYSDGLVVITESEILAMRLGRWNITAIAPTSGAKSIDPELKKYLAQAEVVIIGDNDPAGIFGAVKRKDTLGHGRIVYPPMDYKDMDEYLTEGGDPWKLIGEKDELLRTSQLHD